MDDDEKKKIILHELLKNTKGYYDVDKITLTGEQLKWFMQQARASERKKIIAELEERFGKYWAESYLMGQLYDFVMKKKKED